MRILSWCLPGASIAALGLGCGNSAAIGPGSSNASGSGQGGAAASQASASAQSGSTAPSGSTAGAGGDSSANCTGSLDSPCKLCAASKCTKEAVQCAKDSACNASGVADSGCLALVTCAAKWCAGCMPMSQAQTLCILYKCQKELDTAGGPLGPGAMEAQGLGACVQMNCASQCLNMGAGGGGAGCAQPN